MTIDFRVSRLRTASVGTAAVTDFTTVFLSKTHRSGGGVPCKYRKQYVFKCEVVAWYGCGRQKILATFETRFQYSCRDRTTYRVASGSKWTRTGGWSWTRTSRTYVSFYRVVCTRG
ncbi:hypothetical protein ACWC0A_04400 [Streptomyces scopuliridis]